VSKRKVKEENSGRGAGSGAADAALPLASVGYPN